MLLSVIVTACVAASSMALAPPKPELGEAWGYVDVRAGAHMFWWLYGYEGTLTPEKPLVMWLQGGPGGSGTGFGNFMEIGPLDSNLNPRTTSWTSRANVLFVDNPVGTGFSYVDHKSLLTRTDEEIAADLVTLTEHFFKANPEFQKTPFLVFCESYGGKMTSLFGEALQRAILAGQLDINFRGVALGDGWVSPIDSMAAWVPYLYSFSLINDAGVESLNVIVNRTRNAMAAGKWTEATSLWNTMEGAVANVESLAALMNGEVKRHLGVNVTWGAQSQAVFTALAGAFMKNSISSVDYMLQQKVPVTIYQGQLDLIVPTIGTEEYMKKLTWPGMPEFRKSKKTAIWIDGELGLFNQEYENLNFFSVMKAGHMVPADQGKFALTMMTMVLERQILN